jgi:methylated-DNA-[protein]-cysteine S-methyltransferase
MKSIFYYNFIGHKYGIAEDDGAISHVFSVTSKAPDCFENRETPLIKKAAAQLGEYLKGKRKTFDLPLKMNGTAFQVKVWKALQRIPYGKTCSYGEIAAKIGNPKACRAVGMANNRNPIAIIVPCHRVIGKDGSLTGYAGGLDIKKKLLKLEGSY